MADTKFKVDISINPVVDKNTASLALSLVNLFLNHNCEYRLEYKLERDGTRNYILTNDEVIE